VGPELRARRALERIAADLRTAGEWAEDLDRDGALGAGEDLNGNGRLDADWDLEDGATGKATLSFNRRVDETDADGGLLAAGIYSARVTYRLDGGRLLRERDRVVSAGGVPGAVTARDVVAAGIDALRFTRRGRLVVVSLDYPVSRGGRETQKETVATSVLLRN
ncbi:MAG: hypothetical protein ACREID_00670, partial [Planctomycetota bacterium]